MWICHVKFPGQPIKGEGFYLQLFQVLMLTTHLHDIEDSKSISQWCVECMTILPTVLSMILYLHISPHEQGAYGS